MPLKRNLIFVFILLFSNLVYTSSFEWDSSNYPNPTTNGFTQCNMKNSASICDPDAMLTEAERYRLNHELNQLESRTRQDHASTFCEKKGVTGAIAIAKHFQGGTEASVKAVANEILSKWVLDEQCKKSIIIVMAIEDRKFWIARGDRVPIYAAELSDIFNAQKSLFREGQYLQGLRNIIQGIWEKALSKQIDNKHMEASNRHDNKPMQDSNKHNNKPMEDFNRQKVISSEPKNNSSPAVPMSTIIIVVLIIIILLLCCCGCIFIGMWQKCHTTSGQNNPETGRVSFNRENDTASIPSTKKNSYTAGTPIQHNQPSSNSRGCYPSVAVKDEGGGGSW